MLITVAVTSQFILTQSLFCVNHDRNDFAIKEFREMKMQPSLERALRRKDILKA